MFDGRSATSLTSAGLSEVTVTSRGGARPRRNSRAPCAGPCAVAAPADGPGRLLRPEPARERSRRNKARSRIAIHDAVDSAVLPAAGPLRRPCPFARN